ncbi:3-oxo-tetronate kinase [Georgenia sp. MJ206]|uniref:3-oxo-tetronate kinase n=1 Tax=Georgenia wangjunii TaxID=3117730 RepID=UPI002F2616AA
MTAPWLGIVADDVTGACDVAAAVREAGLSTVLRLGAPDDEPLPPCDAVVVGLTIRTVPPRAAQEQAVTVARWLRAAGVRVVYQKYCSTFDSTPHGNIGPVADALAGVVGAGAAGPVLSVGTPATPAAGRTQYQGHLFVGDRLLSESSLRDHPLTPMRDPDLVRVLGAQTPARVRLVPRAVVREGPDAVRRALVDPPAGAGGGGARAHVLVDALDDEDLGVIARGVLALADGAGRLRVVVGGGAGLAGALARCRGGPPGSREALPAVGDGERLILAGSLSERTRAQCTAFPGTRLRLDAPAGGRGTAPDRDDEGADREADDAADAVLAALARAFAEHPGEPVLVTSATDEEVGAAQRRLGVQEAARRVERALARVAAGAVRDLGVRRVVVAGGETSGAVTRALGVRSLLVGDSASPGVPWTVSTGPRPVALLLKSGNFGGTDLFSSAWAGEP